jgi:hypothetical protein
MINNLPTSVSQSVSQSTEHPTRSSQLAGKQHSLQRAPRSGCQVRAHFDIRTRFGVTLCLFMQCMACTPHAVPIVHWSPHTVTHTCVRQPSRSAFQTWASRRADSDTRRTTDMIDRGFGSGLVRDACFPFPSPLQVLCQKRQSDSQSQEDGIRSPLTHTQDFPTFSSSKTKLLRAYPS